MADNRPIGILDSGFGGLSIYQAIRAMLPGEPIIYFGDNRFAPYGKKTSDLIRSRVTKIIEFLLEKNIKLVIIACNTATVVGIKYFRSKFPALPIVGVVPVLKTAAKLTKSKRIAILETSATASSPYQKNLIRQFASGCDLVEIVCDQLVEKIETGDFTQAQKEVDKCLNRDDLQDVDILVLGCTHFVFLKNYLKRKPWQVLDSSSAVARQVKRIVENNKFTGNKPKIEFYTSGDSKHFAKVGSYLLKSKIHVQSVKV